MCAAAPGAPACFLLSLRGTCRRACRSRRRGFRSRVFISRSKKAKLIMCGPHLHRHRRRGGLSCHKAPSTWGQASSDGWWGSGRASRPFSRVPASRIATLAGRAAPNSVAMRAKSTIQNAGKLESACHSMSQHLRVSKSRDPYRAPPLGADPVAPPPRTTRHSRVSRSTCIGSYTQIQRHVAHCVQQQHGDWPVAVERLHVRMFGSASRPGGAR